MTGSSVISPLTSGLMLNLQDGLNLAVGDDEIGDAVARNLDGLNRDRRGAMFHNPDEYEGGHGQKGGQDGDPLSTFMFPGHGGRLLKYWWLFHPTRM